MRDNMTRATFSDLISRRKRQSKLRFKIGCNSPLKFYDKNLNLWQLQGRRQKNFQGGGGGGRGKKKPKKKNK